MDEQDGAQKPDDSNERCGDGIRDEAESCDDGNRMSGDGCSAECRPELRCEEGRCESVCGDGLVITEACDDGNLRDGDGCSAVCEIETGFTCEIGKNCDPAAGPCTLRVPVTYRDFLPEHPDFEVGCGQLATGVVQRDLSAQGKPVLANGGPACVSSPESFREWYTDTPNNRAVHGELVLFEDGRGGYVNRFGARGEPWKSADGAQSFDGSPLFFPIDNADSTFADARFRAKIPEQYGYPGWPWEDSVRPDAPLHNFSFTTEVAYWFRYDASAPAHLEFTGDDDLWVFVNGILAVDLGGCHVPETGHLRLDASSAASFGLRDGGVYEIRVFHAERKMEGSSFKLTLSGFDMQRSECRPICGDGVVQNGEDCDDGNHEENDGCPSSCVWVVL